MLLIHHLIGTMRALTTTWSGVVPGPIALAANEPCANQDVTWVTGKDISGAGEPCALKHVAILKPIDWWASASW